MRIFLALNLPLGIRQDIFNLYAKIKEPQINPSPFSKKRCGVKWTNSDNLHITLKFIGGVGESDLQKLKTFLTANLKIPSIDLKIKNTIFFPKFGQIKIIALQGIIDKKTEQEINHFLNLLNQKLKFISKDNHPFAPHITIGRVKKSIKKENYEFKYENECKINSIELMQSTLTPDGPIYKIIKSYATN